NFADMMGQMGGNMAKTKQQGIVFSQGQIFQTQVPTNMAIDGNGFFAVTDGTHTEYTRDGRFEFKNGGLQNPAGQTVVGYKLNEDGSMSGQSGPMKLDMDPNSKLWGGKYNALRFDENGILYGQINQTDPTTGQQAGKEVPIYQVQMASFANASGLKRVGTTNFQETESSGKAVTGVAGQGNMGSIQTGALEMSNVDFAQQAALVQMTKQNFDANMAAYKAMDKLAESAIGLVR
ncbi:MAG TPA: flagellar hook basal-body protein, partial [Candidatus Xenobia bacterium]